MAGNKVLQILRGKNSAISSSTDTLLPGQPLYNVDKKYLIVGDDSNTQIQNAEPITTNRLISYNDNASLQLDSNGNIVASGNSIQLECNNASEYSILLNDSELSIDVDNITSTASVVNFTAPTLTSTGNFTVDSDNIYLGNSKIGNVHIKGVLDVDSNLQVSSDTNLDGALNVEGATTLSTLKANSISSASIANSLNISTSTLDVTSSATIKGLTAPNAALNKPTISGGIISDATISKVTIGNAIINNAEITGGSASLANLTISQSLTTTSGIINLSKGWTINTSSGSLIISNGSNATFEFTSNGYLNLYS